MEKSSQALAGKHAVVTGGARGIGAAVTRALVAHGANVTMLGRSPNPSTDLADDPQLHYVQANVCEPENSIAPLTQRAPASVLFMFW